MQPAVVVLPKKQDLLSTLKDKLLPAAAPPPPGPIAISGAPLAMTPVVRYTPLTARLPGGACLPTNGTFRTERCACPFLR